MLDVVVGDLVEVIKVELVVLVLLVVPVMLEPELVLELETAVKATQ